MKAVKSIERLIRELQLNPEGDLLCEDNNEQQLQLWSSYSHSNESIEDFPESPCILALPSTRRDSPKQSNPTSSKLLREELEKVSKQLAEQKALVATLEVEITTVLQEKKIQELDYKSHIQQLEDKVAHLKQRLQNYYKEEDDTTMCEDLLCILEELFSHDISIHQPLYKELLAIPIDKRKTKDHILLLIYGKILNSQENYEQCWNDRENLRCTLAQANQEIQRLDKDLKKTCKIAESEKQEMLQEVERLTSQWRDLSILAGEEKQVLVKQVQKLNDELREVTNSTAIEKQEIRDEVEQLTHKLRSSQDIAHKDRKSMRIEIQRLANEVQQGLSSVTSDKQLLSEEVQLLNNKLRVTLETTTNEKHKLNVEIARLMKEFQQQSTSTNIEKKNLNNEVIKLKDELRELSTSVDAEKQEMTNQLHKLNYKVKHLFATSVAEKQSMQLKLEAANTRNDKLAREYQHALLQLESLTNEYTTNNIELKEEMDGIEMRVSQKSLDTQMIDANIHELMDETRQLLEQIEFKDHSMSFHNKSNEEQHPEMQQILLQVPRNQDIVQNPIEAHIKELLPQEHHLQVSNAEGLEHVEQESQENTNIEVKEENRSNCFLFEDTRKYLQKTKRDYKNKKKLARTQNTKEWDLILINLCQYFGPLQ